MKRPDILIAGAGLAGGLLAWRLSQTRPDLGLLVVEAGERAGGNHTWSFHQGDLTPAQAAWIAPIVAHRWPSYDVRFPNRVRTLATGYASAPSETFHQALSQRLGSRLRVGTTVRAVEPQAVVLADGERIEADAVVDARGPRALPHLDLGFQKFLGQELEFERPHGLQRPVVMDATVTQSDGYRFVYCLPFSPTRMLIEDTYYADGPGQDRATLAAAIETYAARAGWGPHRLIREEDGVLPIALGGDHEAHVASMGGVPTVGLAAALFHPTTGYSLPDAVRTAELVADVPDLSAGALASALIDHGRRLWRERRFFRGLNRMLFLAGEPLERYRVLEHFHRLPEPVIARFYAGDLSAADKARILVGKPPVPVAQALRVLLKGRA